MCLLRTSSLLLLMQQCTCTAIIIPEYKSARTASLPRSKKREEREEREKRGKEMMITANKLPVTATQEEKRERER